MGWGANNKRPRWHRHSDNHLGAQLQGHPIYWKNPLKSQPNPSVLERSCYPSGHANPTTRSFASPSPFSSRVKRLFLALVMPKARRVNECGPRPRLEHPWPTCVALRHIRRLVNGLRKKHFLYCCSGNFVYFFRLLISQISSLGNKRLRQ